MSSGRHRNKRAESQDAAERYTYEDAATLDESAFEGSSIGRRTFLQVAAATGAALALPSTVSAEVDDERVTDLAEFAVNATPDDYEATLVLEFEDSDGVESFYTEFGEPDWDIDEDDRAPKVVYREDPTPAAHAYLTVDELDFALDEFDVEYVDFSPGANPFWKLEDPFGDYEVHPEYVDNYDVFPRVEHSRDWISHTEAGQALDHVEAQHPDMVNVRRIGHGPGWSNQLTNEDRDRRDLYVVELTNDVQDRATFQEKDKAVFILGIHGNERAGVAAGSRIIENAARGEADEFTPLLDDVAIVFVYINPDGWLVRNPHIGWGDELHPAWRNFYDIDEDGPILQHWRGNASEQGTIDTNRQYPTIGWADPSFWPAEPDDLPDERPDTGVGYEEIVPDALATVDHLREYANVEYVCDYHMMGFAPWMVLNLESNAVVGHLNEHNLDQVNIEIGEGMRDQWGSPEAIADDTIRAGQDTAGLDEYVPTSLFDYGSIHDSIGYNVSGALLDWAGQPEEFGGLGAITVAPELSMRDFAHWRPYIERHLETAYYVSMREHAEMTAADTDATVVTGEQDTAYVTASELTRTSADLSHTDKSPGQGHGRGRDRATEVQRRHDVVQPGPEGSAKTSATERTHSLSVTLDAHGVEDGVVQLINPAGRVVQAFDFGALEARPCHVDHPQFFVHDPDEGEWSVAFDGGGEGELAVSFFGVETDEEHPDPEAVFGYSQTEYVVNPMQFFADLEPFVEDGEMDGMRLHDVKNGRLMRGRSGERHYDKLVISSDAQRDDDEYISAIEEFVEAGGDLVLTDRGLHLLAELDVGDAADISEDDLETVDVYVADLVDRDFDHYLLEDIRPLQQELWKSPQIGYAWPEVDQPATMIDDDAFEAAGGDVAGRMEQTPWWVPEPGFTDVAAGSLSAGDSEINVIGSILPPANQEYLHPFGMADYATSFMGHTVLLNALGFEQRRYVDGELVGTWGELRK